MTGLMEAATAVMRTAETRLDVSARNVASASVPGYKTLRAFSALMADGRLSLPSLATRVDVSQGKLQATGNPLDLAISGDGFFAVGAGGRIRYVRQGQFSLAHDGTVVTPQGYALQQAGGGDLVLDRADVRIDADGTVFDGDRPVARIALVGGGAADSTDGVLFDLPEPHEADAVAVRQGMLETSNVSTGEEMVAIMGAIREAESGARLVQTWDDLLGRAITSFGQSGR